MLVLKLSVESSLYGNPPFNESPMVAFAIGKAASSMGDQRCPCEEGEKFNPISATVLQAILILLPLFPLKVRTVCLLLNFCSLSLQQVICNKP